MPDRAAAIARYHEHIEEVKAAVPADRRLVFSVKEGWKPLCIFLNLPIPETPFPNINDRATMLKRLGKAKIAAYGLVGFGGAALATLIYAATRMV